MSAPEPCWYSRCTTGSATRWWSAHPTSSTPATWCTTLKFIGRKRPDGPFGRPAKQLFRARRPKAWLWPARPPAKFEAIFADISFVSAGASRRSVAAALACHLRTAAAALLALCSRHGRPHSAGPAGPRAPGLTTAHLQALLRAARGELAHTTSSAVL